MTHAAGIDVEGAREEGDALAELRRRERQQAAVAELGRAALLGLPYGDLRLLAADLVAGSLPADRAAVLELDSTGTALTCRSSVGWPEGQVRPVPLGGRSQLADAYLSLEPVVVVDYASDEAYEGSRHLAGYGIASGACVPVRGEGDAVGVLVAHTHRRRAFSGDDVVFLRSVANVLAAAAARERADAARLRSEARLALLAEAADVLARSLDAWETLPELVALVVPRLADRCEVALTADGAPRLVAVAGEEVADARTLVLPLAVAGRTLGELRLDRAAAFDAGDRLLADDLARRIALAVENARLHRAERSARRRAERLQAVAARLAEASTVADVATVLVRQGTAAVGAAAGWVGLLAPDGRTLEPASALGYPAELLDTWRHIPLDSAVGAAEAVRTRRPLWYPDADAVAAAHPQRATAYRRSGFEAAAVIPLVDGGASGFLALNFREPHTFDADERELLVAIARQCGQALARARLYDEREERASAAFVLAHVADAVLLVDDGGVVRYWNPAATRITGIEAADAVGRPVAELVGGWERVPSPRPPEGDAPRETVPIEVGGRELWLSVGGVRVEGGAVFALRDLTAERALEEARRDFLATASHELRTPLTAVYGAAQTLLRHGLEGDVSRRLLEMIVAEGERLSRIVDDMLLANRLDGGRVDLEVGSCDGAALAASVVDLARQRAPEDVELRLDVADGVPAVAADPDRLRQVLVNLVDNAIKYSPGGGGVDVAVEASLGPGVRFSVADRGLGIPAAEHELVFEKFYRLDPKLARGVGGTGLGLYISRELVERMGGRITVDSAPGHGSTFTVELPAAPPA